MKYNNALLSNFNKFFMSVCHFCMTYFPVLLLNNKDGKVEMALKIKNKLL